MRAKLICESSAGMTAVEIYDEEKMGIVWSHRWFEDGCSDAGYINGLCEAYDCMRDCANFSDFDGGAVDDEGNPIDFDDSGTTGIMLEFDSRTQQWSLGGDAFRAGQSREIADALMACGAIEKDGDFDDDSEVVRAIISHINSRA